MQLALAQRISAPGQAFRLPPNVPPFSRNAYRVFTALWLAAFLIALAGPLAGFVIRYTGPANNSQLLLGSRAGFAVSPADATLVRFAVGPQSRAAGLARGDRIVAVYGLPLPATMAVDEHSLALHADDPAYIAMGNLLFGSDSAEVPLTVRTPSGAVREVTVTTGEQHIDAGARALGISPRLLSVIDLLHVLAYPLLLWAAWLLHRRNARDVVSSLFSLAILLTIAAEQPSSVFLAAIGVPRGVNVAIYDLGNVLLLAGIFLFPHGKLSWRVLAMIACVPLLMLLSGTAYHLYFVLLMALGVLSMLARLRSTRSPDQRQQIRWALLGISAYAVLRCAAMLCDALKWSSGSFGEQMLIEIAAGLSFALAVIFLQLGLLIALLRYRLYDAEAVISRSANVALVTLAIVAVFAGLADGLKQIIYNYYGNTNSEGPIIFAAALSTVLVNPIQDRVQRWSERRFQKNLFLLRDDLPEVVRDMRETASLHDMIAEILARVDHGVRSVRSAAVVNGAVLDSRGVSIDEVEQWCGAASTSSRDPCDPSDRLFPIRVPLVPSSDDEAPIGTLLVGPRPDGSLPSRDEQKALAEVSESVARAIRTVIRREAREREVAERIADNHRRIEALEALLGAARSPRGKRPQAST